MADNNSGGGRGMAFILGAVVVVVGVLAYIVLGGSLGEDEPALEIGVSDEGVSVDTNN